MMHLLQGLDTFMALSWTLIILVRGCLAVKLNVQHAFRALAAELIESIPRAGSRLIVIPEIQGA